MTALQPEMLACCRDALTNAASDMDFLRLCEQAFEKMPSDSIDYAIMEQADNLSVIPLTTGWSDLGGWDAVWRETQQDGRGVATSGSATAIDCDNTLLRSEDSALEVVGIGLNNIITVAMPDAVLVVDVSRAQDVKLAVATLRDKKLKQATTFPKDHRPWGWFESLVIGDRFQVKRITVRPGAALSLQNHYHRSEHWIVVEGIAKVTINDSEQIVSENQSVYIPLGAIHRMENPGKLPLVIIEVQTGSYLGEDDIVRHEDDYARE
ncbi:MAG: cupin domain-containing protein, partial [Tateyamaria sp.]|nr:cupin domain-containing protein [Tateyamaria sp.]